MSQSTSRRSTAAVLGALFVGVAGCGGGMQARTRLPGPADVVDLGGGGSSLASPMDQHADFAEFDLTEGSEPPPGEPPASDDDSDCGTPGAP